MQNKDRYAQRKWLSVAYWVTPVQPFRVRSVIGSARSGTASNGFAVGPYLAHYLQDVIPREHLAFALE
jgi:hypothetical protein